LFFSSKSKFSAARTTPRNQNLISGRGKRFRGGLVFDLFKFKTSQEQIKNQMDGAGGERRREFFMPASGKHGNIIASIY